MIIKIIIGKVTYATSRDKTGTWNSLNDEQKNEVVNRANQSSFDDPKYQNDRNGVDPQNVKAIDKQLGDNKITGAVTEKGEIRGRKFEYYEGNDGDPYVVFVGSTPSTDGMKNNLEVPNGSFPTPQPGKTADIGKDNLPADEKVTIGTQAGTPIQKQETDDAGTFIKECPSYVY